MEFLRIQQNLLDSNHNEYTEEILWLKYIQFFRYVDLDDSDRQLVILALQLLFQVILQSCKVLWLYDLFVKFL